MIPYIRLFPNHDGTYDLILEYSSADVEFANEFHIKQSIQTNSKKISEYILSHAKKVKIKSVKILVSGVVVATIGFSSFLSVFAASDRYIMGYLYTGTDHQQIEYVNQTNGALDTVSPSYFDIRDDGSLKLNYLSSFFIQNMHDKGIKVVPFLSNHWNRTAGINALKDVESLSTQIANYVSEYDLDGVNVDIENVTHEQRDQYTELVKLLRKKIPAHKEVSVAVAANPNNWQVGWHGSYDYAALAQYADHLFIMAYDEHYEGGEAGPVASIHFVEQSIQYALTHTTSDKIVVGVPFYGRVWSEDNNRIVGKGISTKTIQKILQNTDATITYDENSQSVKARFTLTESDPNYTAGGVSLEPGNYVVWYENDDSYQEKLSLIEKYNLKGAGAWSLGQEDTAIWEHYESWVNGDASDLENEDVQPPVPSVPESPETDEIIPPSSENNPTTAWIKENTDKAPVYKNENLKGKVIASLTGGTAVSIIKEANSSVYQIRLADGQIGYISSDHLIFEKLPDTSVPPSNSSDYFVYEIKLGDTLWKIAERYLGQGNRYPEIMRLNGLTDTNIYPGMQLRIPIDPNSSIPEISYREYTVKRGDSLWKIAKAQLDSGNRYTEIMELNGLTSEMIIPGQILKLPK